MRKKNKSTTNLYAEILNLDTIDDIAGEDKTYRQELIGLSLIFFQDLKVNFRFYMIQRDEVKLHYMIHKAQSTLGLFETEAVNQLLQVSIEYLAQNSIDIAISQQTIENMDKLCDFFILNLQNQLDYKD